jgi:hypothetical protein
MSRKAAGKYFVRRRKAAATSAGEFFPIRIAVGLANSPHLLMSHHLLRLSSELLRLGVFSSTLLLALSLQAADEPAKTSTSLDPHLEPLRPLLDKTWKGTFASSKPDKPTVDVMRWERALNGRSLRVLHSINEGSYGGETIYRWDKEKQAVTYYYFTTAGFMTTGTMTFADGKFITHELVSGNSGGTTEVKAISELRPDGTFVVKTEHRANGEWKPGRETVYHEAPDAKVIFR